jgi:excisionase family DNA binding protein
LRNQQIAMKHSLAIRLNPANPDHHHWNTFPDSSGTQSAHVRETWGNYSLLTKQQAASYVGCSRRYLERAIVAGRLRALKPTGKLLRIRRSDLDAFLESGATIGGAE